MIGGVTSLAGHDGLDWNNPMKFCSFMCDKADNKKAQHAACLAVNGVFCGLLGKVVEKGMLCPFEGNRASLRRATKEVKKKSFR